jgi:hypothetical protein
MATLWPVVKSMREVRTIIASLIGVSTSKLLLVLDFDKTLGTTFFSPTEIKRSIQEGCRPSTECVRLCDPETPEILQELRNSGVDMMILTARSRAATGITEEAVKAILPAGILVKHKPIETAELYMTNGICYSGTTEKGVSLLKILPILKRTYECIIQLDDLAENLVSFINHISGTSMRFIPILYYQTPSVRANATKRVSVRVSMRSHVRTVSGFMIPCGALIIDDQVSPIEEPVSA